MGREAICVARIGRRASRGKALLESTELIFRGDERVVIPFASIRSATAADGVLRVRTAALDVRLELGPAAARWLESIRSPKSLMEKLGVRPGQRVSVLGVKDAGFLADARARADVGAGRVRPGSGLVFLAADSTAPLARLGRLRDAIARDGGIWVVWPKGQAHIKEDHVRAAGKAAGLVDVKVVAFSATHSALKLVIPVARR